MSSDLADAIAQHLGIRGARHSTVGDWFHRATAARLCLGRDVARSIPLSRRTNLRRVGCLLKLSIPLFEQARSESLDADRIERMLDRPSCPRSSDPPIDSIPRTARVSKSLDMRHSRHPRKSQAFLVLFAMLIGAATLLGAVSPARAQYDVPSDGSDGAFNPTADIEIDLTQAVTGAWNTPGNGKGVYDPEQWLVVFKYTSVNIPAGVTVTFKNHPKNPPVAWLVQGSVVVDGRIDLSGREGTTNGSHGVPGPGGFAGSRLVGPSGAQLRSGGFGPGGGSSGSQEIDVRATSAYGNSACFPLIGGSGGGTQFQPWSCGGGGGAILVASRSRISINNPTGSTPKGIAANGGWLSGYANWYSYSGGGAVRLVAPVVDVFGKVEARSVGGSSPAVSEGRVRVETLSLQGTNFGSRYSVGDLGCGLRFLRNQGTPAVKVLSVNSTEAVSDPSSFVVAGFDCPMPVVSTPSVSVRLECRNVPENATVEVYLRATESTWATKVLATRESGDAAVSIWTATGTLGIEEGRFTVQARAILP